MQKIESFDDSVRISMQKSLAIIAIAAIIALISYAVLPFAPNPKKGLSLLIFIAILWLTEALHVTITAILVVVIGTLIKIDGSTLKVSLAFFANPIIYLYFGGFALAAALSAQKLDYKIALKIISLSGGRLSVAVFLMFGVTAGLSMWFSNTATTAMMLPLALGLLSSVDAKKHANIYIFVLLGIAYSSSIGGMATPLGSAPNAIAQSALNMSFSDWTRVALPISLVLLVGLLGSMFLVLRPKLSQKIKTTDITPIPMTRPRVLTLCIFLGTIIAWISSKFISKTFGIAHTDTLIALIAAVLVVVSRVVTWAQIQRGTDWGVLILFGGGLALSEILKTSGASLVLGQSLASVLHGLPIFGVILCVASFIIFLTEFSSNTASAALFVPIFASVAAEMGLPPQLLVMIIGIGASCAFMLPVATPPNAIVFGTGFIPQSQMIRVGLILNFVAIFLVSVWAYAFFV